MEPEEMAKNVDACYKVRSEKEKKQNKTQKLKWVKKG